MHKITSVIHIMISDSNSYNLKKKNYGDFFYFENYTIGKMSVTFSQNCFEQKINPTLVLRLKSNRI